MTRPASLEHRVQVAKINGYQQQNLAYSPSNGTTVGARHAVPLQPSMRYPLFLDLTDQPVVVIGAGRVAARKIRSLLRAGANVTVISPQATVAIQRLKSIRWLHRAYRVGDLRGTRLVVAATDDLAVNRRVCTEARRRKILVNCIAPGHIMTSGEAAWRERFSQAEQRVFFTHYPLNRVGHPEEITAVALFLASDAASFLTGATIPVDGGMSILCPETGAFRAAGVNWPGNPGGTP